jgi:molecular chaperone GrpE
MSNEPKAQQDPEAEAAEAGADAPLSPAELDVAFFEVELTKARDDMLRALAEVENTRKRAARDIQDARAYAIDRFARDLLPVADTLSRAVQAVSPQARAGADEALRTLIEGVELTERAMVEAFGRHGLKRVGVRGEAFDPNLHQAVAQAPSEAPANTVAEVMQPGYVLGERTLRPAMVVVSAGPAASTPGAPSAGGDASQGGGVDIKV